MLEEQKANRTAYCCCLCNLTWYLGSVFSSRCQVSESRDRKLGVDGSDETLRLAALTH
jgi:hypothetical protein